MTKIRNSNSMTSTKAGGMVCEPHECLLSVIITYLLYIIIIVSGIC